MKRRRGRKPVQARIAYSARVGTGEIALAVGDQVRVKRVHQSAGWKGWTTVSNLTTGEEGLVPTSYLPEATAV